MRECSLKCPINVKGKCGSGSYHKKDFDKTCQEREKIIEYYGLKEAKNENKNRS